MSEEKSTENIKTEKEKTNVEEFVTKYNITETIENALNDAFSQNANPYEFLSNYFLKKLNTKCDNLIEKLVGREVLDSRGNPTVECDVYVNGKRVGRSSAPSGASTGSNEAYELRDEDKSRYLGKGVLTAVKNVSGPLNDALVGKSVDKLSECDNALCKIDGTELKKTYGGNAITACSFAIAVAGANLAKEELFQYLSKQYNKDKKKFSIPTPFVNILNGGKHAGGDLKIQEFMIVPHGDKSFKEALRKVTTVYHHLGSILSKKIGKSSKNLGDEGGFAPNLDNPDQALSFIEEAIQSAGYKVGEDVKLAMDCAASEFYDSETKKYEVIKGKHFSSEEMVNFYEDLIKNHPALCSIEDGFNETDYDGWKEFTKRLGDKIMIVGDDLYTTNTNLIKKGIEESWANALLLKVNQIGTISESMEAARMIFGANQNVMVSHRSGETESTVISDLSVAIGAKYIKTGATARGERVAKYNRLLQIEEFLIENDLLENME